MVDIEDIDPSKRLYVEKAPDPKPGDMVLKQCVFCLTKHMIPFGQPVTCPGCSHRIDVVRQMDCDCECCKINPIRATWCYDE